MGIAVTSSKCGVTGWSPRYSDLFGRRALRPRDAGNLRHGCRPFRALLHESGRNYRSKAAPSGVVSKSERRRHSLWFAPLCRLYRSALRFALRHNEVDMTISVEQLRERLSPRYPDVEQI